MLLANQSCRRHLETCKFMLLNARVHILNAQQLSHDIAISSPFRSGLLVSIYYSCLQCLKNTPNLMEEIEESIRESNELGRKILTARRLGHKCAKRAVWIPVTR